ncbi:hypothetical protein T07_3990 [Trichinella nelsoni]|uniref:Uncharacterized protein n=1 Tax=Trichinella nelsoni TaxID=6336 RepID=A0A0V0S0L5_9BILA|nr:hypothetical protein T07_3990 [Trichinella nelsoni]
MDKADECANVVKQLWKLSVYFHAKIFRRDLSAPWRSLICFFSNSILLVKCSALNDKLIKCGDQSALLSKSNLKNHPNYATVVNQFQIFTMMTLQIIYDEYESLKSRKQTNSILKARGASLVSVGSHLTLVRGSRLVFTWKMS